MAHARPLSSPRTVTLTPHSSNAFDRYSLLLYMFCVSSAALRRCAECYVSYIVSYCNFLAISYILTLLFWIWPTTVCGSDIVYSCVLDVVCCPFNYSVSLASFIVPYSHCFMFPVVLLRSGVLPQSLCVFCLVASPTRAVEETCSVMAIFCRLHLLSRSPNSGVFTTHDSSFWLCLCRRAETYSVLLDHQHPRGAAPLPQHCALLRTSIPAAYHSIIYCITCSSAHGRTYIV